MGMQRPVKAEIDVSLLAIDASRLARDAGFSEVKAALVATAVSELARNILKYAGQGTLRLELISHGGASGVEIEASDQGPGIADCEAALRDHFSSGGTLGMGLPGVKRMMDEFHLTSRPGEGTRVKARKWA